LDYAGEGCAVTDAQERFLVVNPAAEEIFGVSPGRLLGRSLLEFLSLDQQDLVRRETMVRTKGNQSTYELEIRREDGVIRTLLITATRRPGLGDEGLQVIGVFRDITERKQAEADRQELANRLQKIASMVPGVVYQFLLRPDGSACFPYASEGLRNMFGYGPEEVREDASKVRALVHPDDQDSFINSIQDSARTLRPWKQEYRVQLAGGVIRTLLGHSVPQREKDGSVLWHGSVLDVTKRRDTARKLEEMVERLALATRAGGVGIWDFDVLGNQLKWDNQMYRLYGIRSTDFGGVYEAWRSGLHPDDAARGDAEIQLALKDEKDFDTEFRVVWPDGSIRHIRALALVQRDAAGRPLRMIGTNWDVTELKQAEEALRHLNQSLQLRVAEEVARRMEHERLLVHQSRLAAMGEMIGNIAHQWRQPLNALAMTLGNIKDARQYGQLTDDYLEASIRQGNAHIQRMSSTITDFMDYFRPEKAPRMFPLREQIRSALKLAATSLDRHGVSVEVANGPEVIAWGHPNEFSQVLMNLLANASDAIQSSGAPSGTIRFDLAAEGNLVRLRVSDDGGGIRTEPIDRIFEPYFTDKPTGTGLGLYMSRMLLEQGMQGTLAARNIPGGAEFTITLPLAEQDHDH
jgi:PAS domain S-box-containing protein